jgi:hypothetical protein
LGRVSAASMPMALIADLPLVPLKQVVLEYLQSGCPESDIVPPFVDTPNSLPWQYLIEDEFEECESPTWVVAQAGACEPLTEVLHSGWWWVPIEIRLIAPISATAEWVQEAEEQLARLLNNVCHLREAEDRGKRSPLAIRLTDVAAGAEIPLYCETSSIALVQRIGLLGERIQVTCELTILCVMGE